MPLCAASAATTITGDCILLDCVCPQTITYSHIICKWFKTAVLPLDKELYIELMKPKDTRVCAILRRGIYRADTEIQIL